MRAFGRRLRWELRVLARRPLVRIAIVAALAFEVLLCGVFSLPAVRTQILKTIWSFHERHGIVDPFSSLSLAIEVSSQTMMFVGVVALVMVSGECVGKDVENGTLRMLLSRPVSRGGVFFQKLVACVVFTGVLTSVVGWGALGLGLLLESPGRFAVLTVRESIFGVHDFVPGLVRYAMAVTLLPLSFLTVTLIAFTLSCLPVKPTTATITALVVILADWAIQAHPALAPVSPYTLMTRLASWRQVFSAEIPWLRLERNYGDLLVLDLALVAVAWIVFARRSITPRSA